jgi:hypothetical protein
MERTRMRLHGRKRRLAVAIAIAAVLGLAGAAGYVVGHSSGANADEARLAGAASGAREGAAVGTRQGYARGLKAGREAGYAAGYRKAYRAAYMEQFQDAEFAAPASVSVPAVDLSQGKDEKG